MGISIQQAINKIQEVNPDHGNTISQLERYQRYGYSTLTEAQEETEGGAGFFNSLMENYDFSSDPDQDEATNDEWTDDTTGSDPTSTSPTDDSSESSLEDNVDLPTDGNYNPVLDNLPGIDPEDAQESYNDFIEGNNVPDYMERIRSVVLSDDYQDAIDQPQEQMDGFLENLRDRFNMGSGTGSNGGLNFPDLGNVNPEITLPDDPFGISEATDDLTSLVKWIVIGIAVWILLGRSE